MVILSNDGKLILSRNPKQSEVELSLFLHYLISRKEKEEILKKIKE